MHAHGRFCYNADFSAIDIVLVTPDADFGCRHCIYFSKGRCRYISKGGSTLPVDVDDLLMLQMVDPGIILSMQMADVDFVFLYPDCRSSCYTYYAYGRCKKVKSS